MKIAVIASFLIAILHSILFYGQKLGLSVFLFCLVLGFFILGILEKNGKIQNKKPLLLSVPIILLSATYFIFNNSFFYVANIIAIVILFAVMLILAMFEKASLKLIINKMLNLILGPLEFLEEAIGSIIDTIVDLFKKEKEPKTKNKNIGKIIKGIIITIPILIIVLILLSSADSIFSNELTEVLNSVFSLDMFKGETYINLYFRLIIIIGIAIYLIAFLYNILEDNFCEKDSGKDKVWKIDTIVGNTILTILNLVYLVFCYIQISVLFMKIGDMQNFDYANYARQGFFQLMAVSLINLVIILITSKKEEINKKLNYTKIMNLLLAGFTIIILCSSFYRMYLYEQAYGYTFLRLMVYFALITEIILIIPTIMYILDIKINLTKTYFVVIILMYILVNYVNIDYIIAKKNIDRYFEDANYELDMKYHQTLSVDATGQIIRLQNAEDENILKQVNYYLYKVKSETENINLQNFNINRVIAKSKVEK